jgi:hypothetical protein
LRFLFFIRMGVISCLLTTNPTFIIIWLVILRFIVGVSMRVSTGLWITYAVILLFTGGIIVLFSYIVTLTSRLKVIFQRFSTTVIFVWAVRLTIIVQPIESIFQNIRFSNLYLFSRCTILGILMFYLLLVLLTVVKLATSQRGPMKSYFKNENL